MQEEYPHNNLPMINSSEIIKRYTFPAESWLDCDTYWLNTSSHGSDEWLSNHHLRLSAANFGDAIGKNNFYTPVQVATDLLQIQTLRNQHNIMIIREAHEWYCRTRDVVISEIGLAVPKWEPRIITSVDGDVIGTDGIIEIRSPLEMYKPLREHMAKISNSWDPPKFYHSHIWESHYAKMQGNMKITGKKWCDYIVYATHSNLSYVERIPFNQTYWDNVLWPAIKIFLDTYMEPMIAASNINQPCPP